MENEEEKKVDITVKPEISYQGITTEQTDKTLTVTETYIGYKQSCYEFSQTFTLNEVYYFDEEQTRVKGTLTNIKFQPGDGPYVKLILTYKIEATDDGLQGKGDEESPHHSRLDITTISVPIEQHPNYKKSWNYFLCSKLSLSAVFQMPSGCIVSGYPAIYWTADAYCDKIAYGSRSAYGPEPDLRFPASQWSWQKEAPENTSEYKCWFNPRKPGLETYDKPQFSMTEYSRHRTKSKANWVVSKRVGRICETIKGDFGVNELMSGNWLCTGGEISKDGNFWYASLSYLHSGDEYGWDPDLYDTYTPEIIADSEVEGGARPPAYPSPGSANA